MEILFFLSLLGDKRRKSCLGNTAGEQVTSDFCLACCNCPPPYCPKRQKCDSDNNNLTGFLIHIFRLGLTQCRPGAVGALKNILSQSQLKLLKMFYKCGYSFLFQIKVIFH